jgi:hypothetical protein
MVYGHLTDELRLIEHAAVAPGAILEVLGESAMANPLCAAKGQIMRKVGRCRSTVSKPVLKAPMVSRLETTI